MNKVFVDTSFWIALADKKERNYSESIKLMKKIKSGNYLIITTNFVLDETFTLVRKRQGISRALELRDTIAKYGSLFLIERVTVADEETAWTWFVRDIDKLSYTDCTSFAVMKRLGVKKAATFDEDFAKVGFEILDKDS
ncbi:PIN domain-containing protein [Candidatus Amesbacteria bacterium]|nr:PIN domain-containing protein [Candidatus Amesbacteria bacterium]